MIPIPELQCSSQTEPSSHGELQKWSKRQGSPFHSGGARQGEPSHSSADKSRASLVARTPPSPQTFTATSPRTPEARSWLCRQGCRMSSLFSLHRAGRAWSFLKETVAAGIWCNAIIRGLYPFKNTSFLLVASPPTAL